MKFDKFAKVVIAGRENYSEDDSAKYLTFKLWEKGDDVKRVYVNDYKRRTLGYIENKEFTLKDNCGLFREEINGTIERFYSEYEM